MNRTRTIILLVLIASFAALTSAHAQVAHRHKSLDLTEKILSGGIKRTYHIHLPATYDPRKPTPIVLIFHGRYMTGLAMISVTRFNSVADKKNFVAVYPDGVNNGWADGPDDLTALDSLDGGSAGSKVPNKVDDIRFVSDLLAHLAKTINVDRRHIYAAGMSNGGSLVEQLACKLPHTFAAIAVVAYSMKKDAANDCKTSQPIPIMFFIGTADPLVPSNNPKHSAELSKLGQALGLSGLDSLATPIVTLGGCMSKEQTIDFWCSHNNCSHSPLKYVMPDSNPADGTRVTRNTYEGNRGGSSEVILYSIEGGGHAWPGGVYFGPQDVLGKLSQDVSATKLITEFFFRHSN